MDNVKSPKTFVKYDSQEYYPEYSIHYFNLDQTQKQKKGSNKQPQHPNPCNVAAPSYYAGNVRPHGPSLMGTPYMYQQHPYQQQAPYAGAPPPMVMYPQQYAMPVRLPPHYMPPSLYPLSQSPANSDHSSNN